MLNYRCLVLDHDDTTVDSTRKVNYAQFCQYVPTVRPDFFFTEEEYITTVGEMGFYEMAEKILHYTEEELEAHVANWKQYVHAHPAPFFPGMPEIIARQKQEGGLVCVVSHSYEDTIRPLYDYYGVTQPDLVFGAEQPPERRKPNPWPLQEIMRRYDLKPEEVIMVDDAPLGGQMAKSCGVRFAGAAWYGMAPSVREKLRNNCDIFLPAVEDLEHLLFE